MSEPTVSCRRCGRLQPALERAPIPGPRGQRVQAQTCAACWREWIEEQTRLINHEHLLPSQPAHRTVLYARMDDFLKLQPET